MFFIVSNTGYLDSSVKFIYFNQLPNPPYIGTVYMYKLWFFALVDIICFCYENFHLDMAMAMMRYVCSELPTFIWGRIITLSGWFRFMDIYSLQIESIFLSNYCIWLWLWICLYLFQTNQFWTENECVIILWIVDPLKKILQT